MRTSPRSETGSSRKRPVSETEAASRPSGASRSAGSSVGVGQDVNGATMSDDRFLTCCTDAATVEAIGTYDEVFGIQETVAMMLCERHAAALRDVVVVVDTR